MGQYHCLVTWKKSTETMQTNSRISAHCLAGAGVRLATLGQIWDAD
jgi:hypothetical protein